MNLEAFKKQLSSFAAKGKPFVFAIDFECENPLVYTLEEAEEHGICFNIKGIANTSDQNINKEIKFESAPVDASLFDQKFEDVQIELKKGNTFLLNLTFPTRIKTNLSLEEIFYISDAPYRILFKDRFVCFSPECFVKITDDCIYTYPMKGTIDATMPHAEQVLMANEKEKSEHYTIVDLMRNDMAMIANRVSVEKFRFVEKISTHRGSILQTSSEIKGHLPSTWKENLGELLIKLLPAGSISGAPKQKTVDIIKEHELLPRGYYTGIFGVFDGKNLDSAVAIRFIENRDGATYFRSGGGITALSHAKDEYKELLQKVYIPTSPEYPLIETLCIKDGEIQNLEWHQWRYQNAFQTFYGKIPDQALVSENLYIPHEFRKGLCKLRIRYNMSSRKNEFEKYEHKAISKLKIVHDDTIDYNLKYTNREALNRLYDKRDHCDDVLIVKKGRITDSSVYNIVFYDGQHWVTPSTPLLKGTARERLLRAGKIIADEIRLRDLEKYQRFKLINAMRAFEEIETTDISHIVT